MPHYELSYEYPLGTGKIVKRIVEALNHQQALDKAGVINPTLTATEVPAPIPPKRGGRASKAPRKTAIAGQHKDFVDFARDNGTIRVQTPLHAAAKFDGDYLSVTGDKVDNTTEHYSIIGGVYKWGATLTLLFPKEGAALVPPGLNAHQYTKDDPNTWCIMDNAFIFELFSIGFRLGKDHKREALEIGLAVTP